ncbi:MAG: serine/threonine protein kinase, partial [Gemmataceae bacterium]|nr:serine/threonine protein kinase [Gemmataceae bacterium]
MYTDLTHLNGQPTVHSLPQETPSRDAEVPARVTASWSPPATQDGKMCDPPPTYPSPFGRYLLLEEIARGGMGVVVRAYDTRLGRQVALKSIVGGKQSSKSAMERFHQEAIAVARLKHRHVIRIFDVGEIGGCHYFTMDLAEQGSLRRHIEALQQEPRRAVAILEKVARAIHYVHEQGLLHRDLKPGNILLDAAGEPMISDFGLAKSLLWDLELTQSGSALGTPAYMAPEQAAGDRARIGPASDIWACGVILFELLVGQRPFHSDSREELLRAIQVDEVPTPRHLRPDLDRRLEAIIVKCLQKEPSNRYASAAALADDLAAWLRGEPIKARPPGRFTLAWQRMRRRPWLACAAVLLSTAAVAAPFGLRQMDPNRQLHPIVQALKRREAVTLIGHQDQPRWWRNHAGRGVATALGDLGS